MPKFKVEFQRTVDVTVTVEAADADEAEDKAMRRDFPLPPVDEWELLKGGNVRVWDEAQAELLREADY